MKYKTLTATTGELIKVSPEDYPRLSTRTYSINDHGYAYFTVYVGKGRSFKYLLHHEVLKRKKGFVVDHENNDRLDCTRGNLRYLTYAQNARNRRKFAGSSPYKGVIRNQNGTFTARITFEFKGRKLGTFTEEIHAALCYDINARRLDPFYRTNFDENHPLLKTVEKMLDFDGVHRPDKRTTLINASKGKYRGIKYDSQADIYVAWIGYGGKKHKLGKRKDPAEAAKLYDSAARLIVGDDAALNFPDADPIQDAVDKAKRILEIHPERERVDIVPMKKERQWYGVYQNGSKWGARIYVDRELRYLGNRDTAEEAAHLYDEEAIKLGRKRLNFPRTGSRNLATQVANEKKNLKKKAKLS